MRVMPPATDPASGDRVARVAGRAEDLLGKTITRAGERRACAERIATSAPGPSAAARHMESCVEEPALGVITLRSDAVGVREGGLHAVVAASLLASSTRPHHP